MKNYNHYFLEIKNPFLNNKKQNGIYRYDGLDSNIFIIIKNI